MKRLPMNRLEKLEQMQAGERRIHFLFMAAGETDADFEQRRRRMIAEGEASAADRFIPFCWK